MIGSLSFSGACLQARFTNVFNIANEGELGEATKRTHIVSLLETVPHSGVPVALKLASVALMRRMGAEFFSEGLSFGSLTNEQQE